MKFILKATDPSKISSDVLISFVWEDNLDIGIPTISQIIKEGIDREGFEGKESQSLVLSSKGQIWSYKVLILGLGKKDKFEIDKLYNTIALAVKKSLEFKPKSIVLLPQNHWFTAHSIEKIVSIIVEAVKLSTYKFLKYKGEEEQKKYQRIEEVFLPLTPPKISAGESGILTGEVNANAVIMARDLINEPPDVTSPQLLADTAISIAKSSNGKVKVKIFEKDEIQNLGMNAFLGVAKGSEKPPKFIRLSYSPSNPRKKVVLIGKGITFDTGGLSLKGPEYMETMKLDMSGAAAVLGVFHAISKISPKVAVVGLIAACENMPSGGALKPGDILRAMNGKTIEVLNTDAEGRLTLADAISFAKIKEKPDIIIDLATLTGACMVALGQSIAGLWGNDKKLIADIQKASIEKGEHVWELPLFEEYRELHKSHIADIKNIQTGRWGGAIAGALFISEFIDKTAWVHLDIAGPAFEEKDTLLSPQGGVGFGVRTILQYLSNF